MTNDAIWSSRIRAGAGDFLCNHGVLDGHLHLVVRKERYLMAPWLILVVMCIYGTIALEYLFKKDFASALLWGGYSLSNVALYILAGRNG